MGNRPYGSKAYNSLLVLHASGERRYGQIRARLLAPARPGEHDDGCLQVVSGRPREKGLRLVDRR